MKNPLEVIRQKLQIKTHQITATIIVVSNKVMLLSISEYVYIIIMPLMTASCYLLSKIRNKFNQHEHQHGH